MTVCKIIISAGCSWLLLVAAGCNSLWVDVSPAFDVAKVILLPLGLNLNSVHCWTLLSCQLIVEQLHRYINRATGVGDCLTDSHTNTFLVVFLCVCFRCGIMLKVCFSQTIIPSFESGACLLSHHAAHQLLPSLHNLWGSAFIVWTVAPLVAVRNLPHRLASCIWSTGIIVCECGLQE